MERVEQSRSHLRRTDAKIDNTAGPVELQHSAVSHDALGAEDQGERG